MTCEECRVRLLAGDENEEVQRHLETCSSCRAELPALESNRMLLGDPSLWEEPEPALGDQVVSLISGVNPTVPGPRWWQATIAVAALMAVVLGSIALFRSPSPDWEVPIPGTDLAPLAMGTVKGWNTDSGTRMLLEVDGLEEAPEGYFYEFWLSEGPVHISAGTFTTAEEVELWAAVARADFPRLWITLEPIDDDESPTRQSVLDTGEA